MFLQFVVGCSDDSSGDIIIPQAVTDILESSFKHRIHITSIKFEENSDIVSIGRDCFFRSDLEFANLSECKKLTLLNDSVFDNCHYLKSVILPPNISIIGNYCFYNNRNLTSIDLPDSVVVLGESAFYESSLTTINISPDSKLESIGERCFEALFLSSIFFPKSLKSINNSAFSFCKLENITIDPENPYFISHSNSVYNGTDNSTLFRVAASFLGEYIVASYVTEIHADCFTFCQNISSIQLHENITSIGVNGFYCCTSLKNILIKGNITEICDGTFYGCTSLTSITIPDEITYIGDGAFYYCTSLTNITIPDKVTYIGNSAFDNCTSLTSITIPGKVTRIESYTFFNCISLTSITIPGKVTDIGYYAFCNCTSLTSITIPGKVTRIDDFAFDGCTNLKRVTFLNNSNTITILQDSFSNIPNPLNVYIPGNFTIDYSYYKPTNIFPERSKLFVTSETTLSEESKFLFGEKRMRVYFGNTTEIIDEKTISVIEYIAIDKVYPKTKHNLIYHQIKCSHLLSIIPCIR